MSESPEASVAEPQAEPDVLDLVEIWRSLDFPDPVTWDDECC